LELYKERVFKKNNDYKVKMFEVEKIGYDATGKKAEGSELLEVANRIRIFMEKENL
jgi:type I restriction enzyme M protein